MQNQKQPTKLKLEYKNKSYDLKDCALFHLTTRKKLASVLQIDFKDLNFLLQNKERNYRVFSKKINTKQRKIEMPLFRLNVVQTRIANLIVRIKQPNYVYSGIKGRCHISNAKEHIGDHPVLTLDIERFFPSTSKKSIYYFFHKTMNCMSDVAGILAELCCYQDHLPTGSRISMPLSYWANSRLYNKIYLLCKEKNIVMSIYVDDLTFSGAAVNNQFKQQIITIIKQAGFAINNSKIRLYPKNAPKLITGVIVTKNEIKIRNKLHKKIYDLYQETQKVKDDAQLESIQKKLFGLLNATSQISDKIFIKKSQIVTSLVKQNAPILTEA